MEKFRELEEQERRLCLVHLQRQIEAKLQAVAHLEQANSMPLENSNSGLIVSGNQVPTAIGNSGPNSDDADLHVDSITWSTFNMKDMRQMVPKSPKMASLPTALDNLLENKLSFVNEAGKLDMGLNLKGGAKLENEPPEHSYKKSGMSSLDMLLKPWAKDRSKCEVLRVTNFVNKLIQKEEDKILVDSQGTKLYIKGGPKKPSLEALTVPQWVIGSICIFYHL